MAELAPRYDPAFGVTFATFCSQHVRRVWSRMRELNNREVPVGDWIDEVLGSVREDRFVMEEKEADHTRRLSAQADAFMTLSVIDGVERMERKQDAARVFDRVRALPEPQRSLLLGLHVEGKTLTEIAAELKLKRSVARWQVRMAVKALSRHFTEPKT